MVRLPIFFLIFLLAILSYIAFFGVDSGLFPFFIIVFGLYSAIYIAYFGIILKPTTSIYAFLCLFCFYTKKGFPAASVFTQQVNLDIQMGVSLYTLLEIVALLAIIVAILVRGEKLIPRGYGVLYRLVGLTGFLSILVVFVRIPPYTYAQLVISSTRVFLSVFPIFSGLIFFSGCFAFIRTQKQIETLLLIFIFSGVALLGELVVFKYLDLFSSWQYWVFSSSGRYNSIIYQDYLAVGVMSVISAASCLYFFFTRKKSLYLMLAVLLLIPMLQTYQRSHMALLITVLGGTLVGTLSTSRRNSIIWTGILSVFVMFLIFSPAKVMSTVNGFLGGDVREQYFSELSFFSRIGASARGLDVFVYSFPFGIGPGASYHYMGSPDVPSYLLKDIPAWSERYYLRMTDGEHVSNQHNLYINLTDEFGLMGLISLCYFIYLCKSNFNFLRRAKKKVTQQNAIYIVQTTSFSILLGLGVYYMFTTYPSYYFLILLFFYLSSPKHIRPSPILGNGSSLFRVGNGMTRVHSTLEV